jgi:hypothetical protein
MTAADLAAWKANNRKQAHCGTIIVEAASILPASPSAKSGKSSAPKPLT